MFKFIFLTVAIVVLIDLHCAEGNLSGSGKGSHKKKSSSSNVVVIEQQSTKCKSGNCKHESGRKSSDSGWKSSDSDWKGSDSRWKSSKSGRKSHHKSRSGNNGKRRSCRGNNCCKGNSCYPVYPPPPPPPPTQTIAPTTSTMAPTTTPPNECPSNSQLIRVTGGEASIPKILAGISVTQSVSIGDISLNLTDSSGQIIGICLSIPLCPSGSALVNLNSASQGLVLNLLSALQISIPVILRNLTDSDGLNLAVCVSSAICPGNTLLINLDTVSLDTVAGFLAGLGIDISSVSKTLFDANGIPAGLCIGGITPCPENTLLLPSGSINQSSILDAINNLGNNVASIVQSVVDPLTGGPLGVCISANAGLTINGILQSLLDALNL